jgi:ornithine carbamoyltransferase
MTVRHFLNLGDLSTAELRALLNRAIELKAMRREGVVYEPLKGRVMGMVFEKSSTRTRVSFEAGMAQFGGHAIFLSPRDTQLGRGEPIEDTARVLSSMVDVVMIRTFEHDKIERFAKFSAVPVINGLTDDFHPCQLLADLQTYIEQRGDITGKTVAWVGDGNNMSQSYINAAMLFDFKLNLAVPHGYEPSETLLKEAGDRVTLVRDPRDAVRNSDLVTTDVWTSMGLEDEQEERRKDLAGYQVNGELMKLANPDALFMHCLPAHRGEEVSADVIDGPQSSVWQQAENRLHAQKALLEFLLVKR